MSQPVINLQQDLSLVTRTGPLTLDRRSRSSALSQLSAGIITCPDGGMGEPWTLPYEEILYVVEGTLTLHQDGVEPIVVAAGEMASLEMGATVTYEGAAGTRAIYALAPADWLERDPEAWIANQAQATTS